MLSTNPLFEDQAVRTLDHAIHGGADFGECITTMQRVPAGDTAAWAREWTATADCVALLGDDAHARGHRVSAAEGWLRAANYYRTAYCFMYGPPVSADLAAAFDREATTFAKAAAALDPPLAPLEIPYEGTSLPGYFVSGGDGVRPILVCTNGYDSTLHEMYLAFGVAARKRGWHCLLFDGPGQGRALLKQGLFLRPDWENVVRPVIDAVLALPNVDNSRVALSGWSLGGYLALRAATGEPRLAALVADPGLAGLAGGIRKVFASLPADTLANPLAADPALFAPYVAHVESDPAMRWKIVQRAFMVHGVSTLQAYVATARDYDTTSRLGLIRCPTFFACEENDPLAQRPSDPRGPHLPEDTRTLHCGRGCGRSLRDGRALAVPRQDVRLAGRDALHRAAMTGEL